MEKAFSASPEVVLDCRNQLGESIIWDDQTGQLHWVNIHDREIWSWDPMSGEAPTTRRLEQRVGAIGLRRRGGLVAAFEKGFAFVDGSSLNVIAHVDVGPPTVRLNDGRVDPAGRFVCGGMDEATPQGSIASLYGLDADGRIITLRTGIACSNSLCWSRDGATMYFTDMPTGRIDAFDYDAARGVASGQRIFASLTGQPGLADGSVVDADGCLWNAQWGGSKLVRYRPDGTVEREVGLPVSNPTCMTFGGPDLDILFVTSAWFTLPDARRRAEPHAGSVFAFRPGVRGVRENRYAG